MKSCCTTFHLGEFILSPVTMLERLQMRSPYFPGQPTPSLEHSPGLRSSQNPLPVTSILSFIHSSKHLLSPCVPCAQVLYPTLWSSYPLTYRAATIVLLYPILQIQQPNSFGSVSSRDVPSQSITILNSLFANVSLKRGLTDINTDHQMWSN